MGFERKIEFQPAYDKRSNEPGKNFGIHGVTMRWLLIGPKGAIQFLLYTNWQLPHVRQEIEARGCSREFCLNKPLPADIGYHALEPQYENQSPMGPCDVLGGNACYYDGSGLRADDAFDALCEGGAEGLWKFMELDYVDRFGEVTNG